ncbi:MAG: DUF2752 domain-containing protein [Verrucomicrobiae bacterium]|nr:DUF2752 domain-containing protein [Verrucomicrobiae bacterium]
MMDAKSDSEPTGSGWRWWGWGLAAVAGVAVLGVLHFHRPEGQIFFPRCSFHAITGLLCPGCGGMRSVHELLNGDVIAAARSNGLFVIGLPAVLAWWGWRRRRGLPAAVTTRAIWGLLLAVLVFTVARNLPWAVFDGLRP